MTRIRSSSDGNFTAALGVPTLMVFDGDAAHTEWAQALVSSIELHAMLTMRGLLETLQ